MVVAAPLPAVRVAKRELRMECDYSYELQSQQRFKALIAGDPDTAQARVSQRTRQRALLPAAAQHTLAHPIETTP